MLQALRLVDQLGVTWYDDVISYLHRSPGFSQVAQAIGDFANTIDDLGVLYDASRLGQRAGNSQRVYRLMEGRAGAVFDNFRRKWDVPVQDLGNGRSMIEYRNSTGDVVTSIVMRPSRSGEPRLEIRGEFGPSNSYREIRLGSF
ncbi:MAG: hypothetical protein GVY25_10055 [Bacteroidetes bacterium]|jgi:hypothetical protein|nr:hypothetical protein [Bacteroidota bacterium]